MRGGAAALLLALPALGSAGPPARALDLAAPAPAQSFTAVDVVPALNLAEAHALALAQHPDVAAADYRAEAQRQVFLENRAGLLPQLSLYGSSVHADAGNTRLLAGGLNNPSVISRTAFGAGMSQLITDFGRTTNLAASAKLSAGAAQQVALATREQVLLAVDRSYFGVLQAQAIEQVARQTLKTRDLLLQRVSILAQNKLKSDLDVSFAQVGLEDARLLVQRAQGEAQAAMASLSAALGYREQHVFALADEHEEAVPQLPGDPGSQQTPDLQGVEPLIAQALQRRPELAGLRDDEAAAVRLARSLRDARLPAVSAVLAAGGATARDSRLPANYSAGGIQVSVPLFAGGLYSARQHEAELRARATAQTRRKLEDDVSRDVRIAWVSLHNAQERLRTAMQLRRYADTAYQLADARYRAGSSSMVELSQAQLAATSAQIEETSARYEVRLREADLAYQSGALSVPDRSARIGGAAGSQSPSAQYLP
ncbi:MAG: TolC family protein [Proteobacteria bacterium]|nr:TolC family protein [Pseudomonadota bacterium]